MKSTKDPLLNNHIKSLFLLILLKILHNYLHMKSIQNNKIFIDSSDELHTLP